MTQEQDKIEQLSVELTAERARRIAAEAEVERMKRGVADVLLKATALDVLKGRQSESALIDRVLDAAATRRASNERKKRHPK